MISLPQFKKSAGEVKDSVDAWLYLLNHASDGKELPDFGNEILEEALERIKVENADDELLARQAKDMVTKEDIATNHQVFAPFRKRSPQPARQDEQSRKKLASPYLLSPAQRLGFFVYSTSTINRQTGEVVPNRQQHEDSLYDMARGN